MKEFDTGTSGARSERQRMADDTETDQVTTADRIVEREPDFRECVDTEKDVAAVAAHAENGRRYSAQRDRGAGSVQRERCTLPLCGQEFVPRRDLQRPAPPPRDLGGRPERPPEQDEPRVLRAS